MIWGTLHSKENQFDEDNQEAREAIDHHEVEGAEDEVGRKQEGTGRGGSHAAAFVFLGYTRTMNEQTLAEQAQIPEQLMTRSTGKPEKFSDDWVKQVVSYHQPDSTGLDQIARVRLAAMAFMREIIKACPDCADRTAAIRHARDAMMSANASIVLHGLI